MSHTKKLPPLKGTNRTPSPKSEAGNAFSFDNTKGEGTQVRKILKNPFDDFADDSTMDIKGALGDEDEGKASSAPEVTVAKAEPMLVATMSPPPKLHTGPK